MTKDFKNKLIPQLKKVSDTDLQQAILSGLMIASIVPVAEKNAFRRVGEQIFLIKKELKLRGIKTLKEDTPLGLRLRFVKEDTLAKAPVKMNIPTITELLSMPLPKDLPKHGYISIQLPEKMD